MSGCLGGTSVFSHPQFSVSVSEIFFVREGTLVPSPDVPLDSLGLW